MRKLYITIFILLIGATSVFADSPRTITPIATIGDIGLAEANESVSAFWERTFHSTQQDVKVWSAACCKVCKKGKACGDSCISRSYTCHKGVGCACDGG
ncbi:hypothetical protein SAMN04488032_1163 [Pacificibacter marinus]|uniref:Uncharacterized protein n=1 Tax=Pacificibacter marinus TaxID=658057 RepID=A0A1Y5TM75_9RHOB|nr:hypothetical protein SAMN04488032_1163 [Pacificibacter marinus]SLN67332.1 hypothetical protein PAM7971_03567 [Pacificibacter marinus]